MQQNRHQGRAALVRRTLTAVAAMTLCAAAAAQSGTVASGGGATSVGYTMGYSLGQVSASAATTSGIRLGEGLQQGFSLEVERIASVEGMPQVELYPNPTAGWVVLRLSEGLGETTVALYASDGRLLEHRPWQGGEMHLDLSALPAGQYMVRIVARGGAVAETYKVVKR